MSDIPNRAELEAELARKVGRLMRIWLARLLALMGDPPDLNNVPDSFWQEVNQEFVATVLPFLSRVSNESAERLANLLPIGVDWALVNEGAVTWARAYSYELVKGITDKTRRVLRKAIGDYFEKGLTRGALEELIGPSFGPVRASTIAVTEITRAASQGEQNLAKEVAAQGFELVPVWQTNNDELVCAPKTPPKEGEDPGPYCGPRNGKAITDGKYPPLHPNCRCWANHLLPGATT